MTLCLWIGLQSGTRTLVTSLCSKIALLFALRVCGSGSVCVCVLMCVCRETCSKASCLNRNFQKKKDAKLYLFDAAEKGMGVR